MMHQKLLDLVAASSVVPNLGSRHSGMIHTSPRYGPKQAGYDYAQRPAFCASTS